MLIDEGRAAPPHGYYWSVTHLPDSWDPTYELTLFKRVWWVGRRRIAVVRAKSSGELLESAQSLLRRYKDELRKAK